MREVNNFWLINIIYNVTFMFKLATALSFMPMNKTKENVIRSHKITRQHERVNVDK